MLSKEAALNELFLTRLQEGDEGIKLAAEAGAAYIKQRLREESFARKIIPPQTIGKSEVTRRVDDDGFQKIVDLEPDSSAMAMSFRAEAPAKYVVGSRFAIDFFKVSSERFEKSEAELLAYEMPITKIIERNSVFDIQEQEDRVFYSHSEAAISGTTRDIVSSDAKIQRAHIQEAKRAVLAEKLEPKVILMTQEMFTEVGEWDYRYVGDSMLDKLSISGWTEPTITNLTLVLTNKGDLVSRREFWLFVNPEYLGRFYVLEDTKFWIDKRADMIEWMSWEYVGMGFGNIRGICRYTFNG